MAPQPLSTSRAGRKGRVSNWVRARFDRTMDRGTSALIGWLGLASLVLIVVFSGLTFLVAPQDNDANGNFFYITWETMLRAIDSGTIGGDQHGSIPFLAMMLLVTIGGIFIVSTFIGVLTTGMNARVEALRKGRAPVIETGHAVILGWSEQVFTVVAELARANQGDKKSRVVIMADHDKVDMEDQIRARVGELGRTRVICRSGSPLKRADLNLVSLDTARSVIVLSPPGEDADIDVIKMLLLLQHREWRPNRPHVVAAMNRTENMAAARLAGGPHAQIVDADDIAVRLVVQSHRQAGLSTVCTDLLNFDGNEDTHLEFACLAVGYHRIAGRGDRSVGVTHGDRHPDGVRVDDGSVAPTSYSVAKRRETGEFEVVDLVAVDALQTVESPAWRWDCTTSRTAMSSASTI